jgi:manganese transport system permease protein
VVLAQSIVFVAVYLFSRRNGVIWQGQRRRSARRRVAEQPSIPTSV